MALPNYSQDAIQRRLGGSNQFSMPTVTGGPSPPPNFYQIGPTQPGNPSGYPTGRGEPDRSRLYDPTYGGPMFNPYAQVGQYQNDNPYPTPYPGIQVSPTGQVTGAQPVYPIEAGMSANAKAPSGGAGTTTQRNASNRDRGTNQTQNGPRQQNDNTRDPMNPQDDPRMHQMKGGPFVQGGRDWRGYSKQEKKFLGRDATLDEALRQLIASQGDYATQYNNKTGNISDIYRAAINENNRLRGVAESDLTNNLASSGLSRSSAGLEEFGGIKADFARQADLANEARTQGLTDMLAERQNFMRQLEIARTQAREEALRRYATKQFEIGGLIG